MTESGKNDHDLIVTLNAKFDSFLERYDSDVKSTNKRIDGLDVSVSKFATKVAVNSLAVDSRIREVEGASIVCKTDMENLEKDMDDIHRKSNAFDGVLTFFTILGSILGIIFGNKNP